MEVQEKLLTQEKRAVLVREVKMAEDVLGKTVKQLQKERTTVISTFTRQANFLSKGADSMVEAELREEFAQLSYCRKIVLEANDDYKTGLLAESQESEEEDAVLEEKEELDVEGTANEAEARFGEVRRIVQTNLWSRYGQYAITTAIIEGEKACGQAEKLPVESTHLDAYEVHLVLLEKRVNEAARVMSTWERWIPKAEREELDGRMKDLKALNGNLELRKAEFVTARRMSKDALAAGASGPEAVRAHPPPAKPIVRIKPTTLPIFSGCKREYHRWKKDWESLQRQGEPSGSAKVKKIQLLDSVDDKIGKDIRLSTYNTAEDMFRVMYGNKSTIAI